MARRKRTPKTKLVKEKKHPRRTRKREKEVEVTLYIPCYNAENHIKFCLEAVLKQTYPIGEILVIDDGSTDRTVDILTRFPIKIIKCVENKGLAAVRNIAIKNAKGKFLASLDADCIPKTNWLEELMKNFSSGVAGVGGRLLEPYISSTMDLWRSSHMKQDWGNNKSQSVSFLFGSNNVFRKKILREVGCYNERYRNNYEDVDISRRIIKKGYSLVYEPEAITNHIKKDDLSSVLDTFWNWNFAYHLEKGYYKNYRSMQKKIKENIGTANRLLREDLQRNNLQLIYPDFLLAIHLSLRDLLFMFNNENKSLTIKNKPFYLLYLNLLDLIFFYRIPLKKKLKTLIPYNDRIFQNFLVILILTGGIIKDKFEDNVFLENLLRYLLRTFANGNNSSENLLKKLLVILESNKKWEGLLKRHPNLEKFFFSSFLKNFKEWLNNLNQHYPDIFSSIKLSQAK